MFQSIAKPIKQLINSVMADVKSGPDRPEEEDDDMKSGSDAPEHPEGSDFDESPSNFNDDEENQESEEEDAQSDSSVSSSEGSDDDDNNIDDKQDENNGLSSYELMRLERIKRNQERLASLGLSQGNNIPKPKKKQAPKPRKRQSVDAPRRELPGRAGRATFMESFTKQLGKREKKEEEDKNPDACYDCQVEGGGENEYLCALIFMSILYSVFLLLCLVNIARANVLRLLQKALSPKVPSAYFF
jgi:hypothetical protein